MTRPILLAVAAAAQSVAGSPHAGAPPVQDGSIRFSVTERPDGPAQLQLTYDASGDGRGRGAHSGPQPWAALEGFDRSLLGSATGGPVSFRLDRAAGDVACSGAAAQGAAAGACEFEPDAAFVAALAERTGARAAPHQLFHLAMSDFRLETLEELDRLGYPRPSLDDVVAAGIHGVDGDYARGMAEAGYRLGSLDDLVAFHIHRVTPAYVAEMAALGPRFRDLPARDLMNLSIHRVTPDFAREMASLGFDALSPDELLKLKIHDVTAEQVRGLAQAGYGDLTTDQHLAFAIHRVTPDYIRELDGAGYRRLPAEQLLRMRIHGVSADYARRMNREGVTDTSRNPG